MNRRAQRLAQPLIPRVAPRVAPTMSAFNATSRLMILRTAFPLLVAALAINEYMGAGYETFTGAPQYAKDWSQSKNDLAALGTVEPELSASADVYANGDWQIFAHGTPLTASIEFSKGALITGAVILAIEGIMLAVAHYNGIISFPNPMSEKAKTDDLVNKRHAQHLAGQQGDAAIVAEIDDNEPDFLFTHWVNDAKGKPEKINTWAYKFVSFPDKAYQATEPLLVACGIGFVLGLMQLFGFNQYFKAMGKPVFDKSNEDALTNQQDKGACVLPYGSEFLCKGSAGNTADEEERKYIMDLRDDDTVKTFFFAAAAVAFVYFVTVIACSMKCRTNAAAPVNTTTHGGNRYSLTGGEDDDLEAGEPRPTSVRTDGTTFDRSILTGNPSTQYRNVDRRHAAEDVEESKTGRISPALSVHSDEE